MLRKFFAVLAIALGLTALTAAIPASAATGDWHEGTAQSQLGLEVEVSWKDTRSGVSVEGIWIHPGANAPARTYTIVGLDPNGVELYRQTVTGTAGDLCIGDPYTELPNPNVLGSIRAQAVTIRVSYVGYHPQYGYVADQVEFTAVRGG